MSLVKLPGLIFGCLFLTCFGQVSQSHEILYTLELNGSNEANPNGSTGIGVGLITYDLDLVTLRIELSFTGLQGNVTSANIHAATATPFSGTAIIATQIPSLPGFPAGVTSGSYDQTIDLTVASSYNPDFVTANGSVSGALNALLFASEGGKAYFDIKTTAFPSGEIRGFLVAVPEPSSSVLALLGIICAATFRRRNNTFTQCSAER